MRESIADRRRRLAAAALDQTAAERAEWLAKHREETADRGPRGSFMAGSGSDRAGGEKGTPASDSGAAP